jgi:D-ribose pyranose/furanose isomerase RbsD
VRPSDEAQRHPEPELSAAIAGLGHGHLVVIADVGLPIPAEARTVDRHLQCGVDFQGFRSVP